MVREIRPALPEEMGEFARIVSLSLAIPAAQFTDLRPEWTVCAFEDGKLGTAYAAWPFTMRMGGGKTLPVAAVTTVSTHPAARRRGNLRAIMELEFRRRHEQGESLAVLYASLAAIYQRYGYAVVTTHHRYNVEPRFLQFAWSRETPGRVTELHPIELAPLVDVYRRFRDHRIGYLHRGAPLWYADVLAPPKPGETLSAALYMQDGEQLGYVVYTTGMTGAGGPGPQQVLTVRDLCWLSAEAYQALWQHLAAFDLVREIHWPAVPSDDPLPHLLVEPRMLNDGSHDGILARIVDVDRAFAGRGYVADGGISFAAIDPLCPWNEGTWQLQVEDGNAVVTRSRAAPAFSAPITTLGMLLFGQLSVSQAARMGRLDWHSSSSPVHADSLLSTEFRPFCSDHF